MYALLNTTERVAVRSRPQPELLERLIAEMALGYVHALEDFYASTKAAVYGFALSIVRQPHDAEDIMQDAYVRLYGAAVSYTPQGKPMAWVLAVVRNLCLMRLREQQKTQALPDDDGLLPDSRDPIGDTLDRMTLQAVLTILSDEERHIIILHSLSGLKHREIAQLLQLPLSTVLNKHRRALQKLQKHGTVK